MKLDGFQIVTEAIDSKEFMIAIAWHIRTFNISATKNQEPYKAFFRSPDLIVIGNTKTKEIIKIYKVFPNTSETTDKNTPAVHLRVIWTKEEGWVKV